MLTTPTLIETTDKHGNLILAVDGCHGLTRRPGKPWRIRRYGYNFSLHTDDLSAALRIWSDFEYDPEGTYTKRTERRTRLIPGKLLELADEWEEFGVDQGLLPTTAYDRNKAITQLVRLVGDIRVSDLTLQHLMLLMKDTRARARYSDGSWTAWRVRKDLCSFLEWCINFKEYRIDNLAKQIPKVKRSEARRERKQWVSAERFQAILRRLRSEPGIASLVTMYACGLRPIECSRVELGHIDFEARTLFVANAKTGGTRIVPLPPGDEFIFQQLVACSAQQRRGPKAFRSWLNDLVGAGAERAKVERFGIYALRNTCITNWLRSGCDPYDVMDWAGHRSIEQTMEYMVMVDRVKRMPPSTGLGGSND